MTVAVIVLGVGAELAAWRVVVATRRSVWVVMAPTLGAMGVAALLVRQPPLSPRASVALAASAGLASGAALYVATRLFVRVVKGWGAFVRQSEDLYGRRGSLSLPAVIALGAGIMALGEELFWRGVAQPRLIGASGSAVTGAAITWAFYIVANLPSASLPIVAGAVVGGAVWAALAVWTHGILASLLCHVCWTALMLAFPVIPVPAERRP